MPSMTLAPPAMVCGRWCSGSRRAGDGVAGMWARAAQVCGVPPTCGTGTGPVGGLFLHAEIFCREESLKGVAGGLDVFSRAFLAVDDGYDLFDFDAQFAERVGGFDDLAACGEDVFDDHDHVARLVHALDLLVRAILLLLVADEEARNARDHA